jgi:uncharacterized protein (DUF433 family)
MADNTAQQTVVRTSRGLSIAGTRITLYDIMDYLKADWPPKLIQQWFNLTDAQIADVMSYVTEHRDEVETEYQVVLQQAESVRAYWEDRNRIRLEEITKLPSRPDQQELAAKLQAAKEKFGLS